MSAVRLASAPYSTRIRIAVTGVALAWTLAAIFLVLGIRSGSRAERAADRPSVSVVR